MSVDIFEQIKTATQTLGANKVRTSLTMLGIIIGNAAVIATIGVGSAAKVYIREQIQSLGTNLLFIQPGSSRTRRVSIGAAQKLVLSDAEAIASQVSLVEAVSAELNSSEIVRYGNKNFSALIFGTIPGFMPVRNYKVAQGRFITDLDLKRNNQVVAIGSDVATALFGDTNPIGEKVRIKNVSLEVIGVMESKGTSLGTNYDETAIVPITTMANQIIGRRSPYGLPVSFIFAAVKNEQTMTMAQFQIENLLRLRHKVTDEDDFSVRNQKDLLNRLQAISGALALFLGAVASISLLVAGIGIMNIMLVSVTDRTQEIGLRKALGASPRDILIQFVIESVILSVMGGAIGTGLAVSGIVLVGYFTPFSPEVSIGAIALATGVSGAIGLFFGVFPAQQAAKLDPIVALRTA
jgi:putative ABC transport system permease protein